MPQRVRWQHPQIGGIDFFALDSNTFNEPLPGNLDEAGRRELQQQRQQLEITQANLLRRVSLGTFNVGNGDEQEDLTERIEGIDEQIRSTTWLSSSTAPVLRW